MSICSRLTDIWVGQCCCHSKPTCIPMSGPIISGAGNCLSGGLATGTLTSITVGSCGHVGQVVSGSAKCNVGGLGKAFLGSQVVGCNIGQVVSGNAKHNVG